MNPLTDEVPRDEAETVGVVLALLNHNQNGTHSKSIPKKACTCRPCWAYFLHCHASRRRSLSGFPAAEQVRLTDIVLVYIAINHMASAGSAPGTGATMTGSERPDLGSWA